MILGVGAWELLVLVVDGGTGVEAAVLRATLFLISVEFVFLVLASADLIRAINNVGLFACVQL